MSPRRQVIVSSSDDDDADTDNDPWSMIVEAEKALLESMTRYCFPLTAGDNPRFFSLNPATEKGFHILHAEHAGPAPDDPVWKTILEDRQWAWKDIDESLLYKKWDRLITNQRPWVIQQITDYRRAMQVPHGDTENLKPLILPATKPLILPATRPLILPATKPLILPATRPLILPAAPTTAAAAANAAAAADLAGSGGVVIVEDEEEEEESGSSDTAAAAPARKCPLELSVESVCYLDQFRDQVLQDARASFIDEIEEQRKEIEALKSVVQQERVQDARASFIDEIEVQREQIEALKSVVQQERARRKLNLEAAMQMKELVQLLADDVSTYEPKKKKQKTSAASNKN